MKLEDVSDLIKFKMETKKRQNGFDVFHLKNELSKVRIWYGLY